jgi:hypothetical protein
VGKVHPQPIGGFARFAMPDVVGENNVELRDIQGLAGAEENVGESRVEERMGGAAGAMKQQNSVIRMTVGVAVRLAKREVMELQFRQGFTCSEAKIFDRVRAFLCGPLGGSRAGLALGSDNCEDHEKNEATATADQG